MGFIEWASGDWFNVLSSLGLIVTLWFTAISIRASTRSRQISNLIAMTTNHRQIWEGFSRSPELARVVDPRANVVKLPITTAEESFVITVILQTSSIYESIKSGLITAQEGLHRDIKSFYSLPLPNAVWHKIKYLQNEDFSIFIDSCLTNSTI